MEKKKNGNKLGHVILGHYRIIEEVGAGAFGRIFSAEDTKSGNYVAIKQEHIRAKSPQLELEYKTYLKFINTTNFPEVYYNGTEGDYRYLVIQLLGKSLEDLYVLNRRPLSLKTVLMIADQMLQAVEYLHKKSIIHRDIKPDNFMMGTGNKANEVFLIDFGLSKEYRNPSTHVHREFVEGLSLTGTARYASINALKGYEQSRRDDMESLGYVWLYLLRGALPWQGLPAKTTAQKYAKILDVKMRTPLEVLCAGFPLEFVQYLSEVRRLGFKDEPDYAKYRQMFRNLFLRNSFTYDYIYDWSIHKVKPPAQPRQPSTQPNTPRRSIRHNRQPSKEVLLPSLNPDGKQHGLSPSNGVIVQGPSGVPHIIGNPTKPDGVVTFGMSPTPDIRRHQFVRSPDDPTHMNASKSRQPSPRNSSRRQFRNILFRKNSLGVSLSDPHFLPPK